MKLKVNVGVLAVALVPVFADTMPVAGNGSGSFSGVNSGSITGTDNNVWTYDSSGRSNSTLRFDGSEFGLSLIPFCPFVCFTPVTVDLGTLIDKNNRTANTMQDLSGTLNIDVNFTIPSGGPASFALGVGLDEHIDSSKDDNVLDLSNFNGPGSSFTVGGETYTVTLDGFYDLFNNTPLNSLETGNNSTNSADLFATITAAPAAVPEPASLILLGTIGGLLAFSRRRRRKA